MISTSRARLSRRGLRWALEAIVVGHLTVARVAEILEDEDLPSRRSIMCIRRLTDVRAFGGLIVMLSRGWA